MCYRLGGLGARLKNWLELSTFESMIQSKNTAQEISGAIHGLARKLYAHLVDKLCHANARAGTVLGHGERALYRWVGGDECELMLRARGGVALSLATASAHCTPKQFH